MLANTPHLPTLLTFPSFSLHSPSSSHRFALACSLSPSVPLSLYLLSPSQVKVMHKQLLLFHNAISAYFAGNQQQLEQTLQQFSIKLKLPGADKPSWLEEQ